MRKPLDLPLDIREPHDVAEHMGSERWEDQPRLEEDISGMESEWRGIKTVGILRNSTFIKKGVAGVIKETYR
jgi:hypothetical protein